MKNDLVSIVIPIYNSEKFLEDCLNSLANQKYKNIEIICIDDGSTDNSINILEKYKKNDKRFKVFRQENQFAGVARNNGLYKAKGKYIMFLDSDDIFEKNMIYNLVKKAKKNDTDIILFGFYHFVNTKKYRSLMGIPYKNKRVLSSIDLNDKIFQVAQGVPWNKFYKKKFILDADIKFQELQSNNDIFFSKMTCLLSNRLLFDNKRYVNYRVYNKNSIQGSYRIEQGNYAKAIIAMYDEMKRRHIYDIFKESYEKYVLDSFLEILFKCYRFESYKIFLKDVKKSFDIIDININSKSLINHNAIRVFKKVFDEDVDGLIIETINYLKENYISKKSIEYRLGMNLLERFKIKAYD